MIFKDVEPVADEGVQQIPPPMYGAETKVMEPQAQEIHS